MENDKITAHQFKILVILTFIGTSVLNAPGTFTEKARQDGWLAAFIGNALALVLVWFYTVVGKKLGNITLVEFAVRVFGKWAGGLLSLTFVTFLLLNSAALVWIVGNFIQTQLLPETPMIVISAAFMFVIIFGSRLGLKAIGRSAEIFFPWMIVGLISLFAFILPESKIENLMPVFESGLKPLLQGAFLFQGLTPLTLVVFLMIFPSRIYTSQNANKAFLSGTLIAGSLIFILTTICILVLGAGSTSRNAYPTYVLAKMISIGDVIQRIEVILAMLWIVTVFTKTIMYFYAALTGFAQSMGLKDYKPYTSLFGIIVVILSQIVYPNTVYAGKWDTTTWMSYVLTNGFLFPLVLLITGSFRLKNTQKDSTVQRKS